MWGLVIWRSRPSAPASNSIDKPSASGRLLSRPRTVTPGAGGNYLSVGTASVQHFALVGGRNLQFLAILCDGAPGEHQPFALQDADNLRVAQRLSRILVLDDLPDALLDRDRGDAFAVRAADPAVE